MQAILEHVLFERLPDELVLVLNHLSFDVLWPAALHMVHTEITYFEGKRHLGDTGDSGDTGDTSDTGDIGDRGDTGDTDTCGKRTPWQSCYTHCGRS